MKITSVDAILVDEPAVTPAFRWRDGLPGSDGPTVAAWLRIGTDEGLFGYAPCRRGVILADYVARRLEPELLGNDPLSRELIWHRLWELDRIEDFPTYIQGVVDDALWDLAGKITGLPVHQLIGSFRESVPSYASTVTFDSVEAYLDVVDQCLDLGFSAIKLHAWGDLRRDRELCERLRAHVGPSVPLMFDGSAGYDLLDAIELGKTLAAANYLWYEEPIKEFSISAYARLREKVDVPLLVGETSEGAHMNSAEFIHSNAADALRTGSYYRGGITGALRIAHLAESFQMRAEVHGGGLANTHLCMSIPNNTYYEALIDSRHVRRPAEVDANGLVHAPMGPGMGHEESWAADGAPWLRG
ncbi:MAG: hypothetical protein IIZ13_14425 [Renibacterium sp.]|nr:hypothetical protein [Renibacterium sp.]